MVQPWENEVEPTSRLASLFIGRENALSKGLASPRSRPHSARQPSAPSTPRFGASGRLSGRAFMRPSTPQGVVPSVAPAASTGTRPFERDRQMTLGERASNLEMENNELRRQLEKLRYGHVHAFSGEAPVLPRAPRRNPHLPITSTMEHDQVHCMHNKTVPPEGLTHLALNVCRARWYTRQSCAVCTTSNGSN